MAYESTWKEGTFEKGAVNPTRVDDLYNFALRDARIKMGLSGSEVAEIVGISPCSYFQIEHLRSNPSKDVGERIANVVEQPESYIFPENLREISQELGKIRSNSSTSLEDRAGETCVFKGHEFTVAKVGPLGYEELQQIESRELSPEEASHKAESYGLARDALETLSERFRQIIEMRFGLGDIETPMSLRETGNYFGISAERVRQLEAKALTQLKQNPEIGQKIENHIFPPEIIEERKAQDENQRLNQRLIIYNNNVNLRKKFPFSKIL